MYKKGEFVTGVTPFHGLNEQCLGADHDHSQGCELEPLSGTGIGPDQRCNREGKDAADDVVEGQNLQR